jgi:acyl-CoA thioester hydrolase
LRESGVKNMKNISYIDDYSIWRQSFSFYHPVTVRFSETDMFGHMNNTVPFIYFEEARIEFFKHIGFMQKWTKQDSLTIPVVADLQCDFLRQVFFGEKLKIYVKVHHVGNSSVDLHYMARNENDDVCFVGRGTIVQIAKNTGKTFPWSESMREILLDSKKENTILK